MVLPQVKRCNDGGGNVVIRVMSKGGWWLVVDVWCAGGDS